MRRIPPINIKPGAKKVTDRHFSSCWMMALSPGGLLVICILLLFLLVTVPNIPQEDLGIVTVTQVIGSAGPGYLQDRTWTLRFAEQPHAFQVVYAGSVVDVGEKFRLQRQLDGEYAITDE